MKIEEVKVNDLIELIQLDDNYPEIPKGTKYSVLEVHSNWIKATPETKLIIITFPEGGKLFKKT